MVIPRRFSCAAVLAALCGCASAPPPVPEYRAPFVDITDTIHWQTIPMDPPLLFCIEYNQGVLCVAQRPDGTADRVFVENP